MSRRSPRPLFLTGIARGGTNLVARMLAAHPEAMVAIDPFLPLYKSLRNAIVRRAADPEIRDFDEGEPLHDSYFSARDRRILDRIERSDLEIPFEEGEWPGLAERLAARAAEEAGDLVPHLGRLAGARTYREIFARTLDLVASARGAERRRWVGSKDVWTIDFFPALARAFPEARFIVIRRDPRGVVASNEPARGSTDYGHPFSYARHWRKQVAMSLHFAGDPLLAERCRTVVYEDLVSDPEASMRSLCRFLEIDFAAEMLDASRFHDYTRNAPWTANTSFGPFEGIHPAPRDRWRSTLDGALARTVEFLCGPEMTLAGYDAGTGLDRPGPEVLRCFLDRSADAASWRSTTGDPQSDLGFELFRRELLGLPEPVRDEELVRRSFLYDDVHRALRDVVRAERRGLAPAQR